MKKDPSCRPQAGRSRQLVVTLALIALAAAYAWGLAHRGQDEGALLRAALPGECALEKLSTTPLLFAVRDADHTRYAAVETAYGYGGPLTVATLSDNTGTIDRVLILEHKETPSYLRRVQKNGFFDQFQGKITTDQLRLDADVDAVSGATVSSRAFTRAVHAGSHALGTRILHQGISEPPASWQFGRNEILLLVLYALILVGVYARRPGLRYVTLTAGCVFLGFFLNTAISLSNLSAILLGFVPSLKAKTFWWLLVMGTVIFTLFSGRNLYCTWLCPFGAIQEATSKISGINVRLPRGFLKAAKNFALGLTWCALMIIFASGNPSLGTYEPFAALFGQEGTGVQWFILPLVILGSFILPRFWCRFFCPVGVMLKLTARGGRTLKKTCKRGKPCPVRIQGSSNCSAPE